MFVKFGRHSVRVKSVSFHPHRPWVFCAFHSRIIKMIDYKIKEKIKTYDDHQGEVMILQLEYGISNNVNSYQKDVRCVTFHAIIWVLLGSENQKARLLNLSKQISYSDFDRTYSSLNVLIFLSQKGFDFHMFMEL